MLRHSRFPSIRLIFLALLALASLASRALPALATHTSYNAGAIVSDSRFTNYNSMSEAGIQNWLVSQNAVCLKDYRDAEPIFDTSKPRNVRYEGSVLASRIIWKAAQQFQINPHVILVTLQKENSFITRTTCSDSAYRTAMGMGCPDGADCDAEYFGFSRQVWEGTKLLRNCFWQDVGWFCSYRPNTTAFVKYNPDSSCGGSNVFISNRATATLYTYTPYQPNTAALQTMGTAPCGAYGNRNFLHFIDLWFPEFPYQWQLTDQKAYRYNTSTSIALDNIPAGEKVVFEVKAKNISTATWFNSGANPVRIGTSRPNERSSPFCDPSWIACHRPVALQESSVAPGATGTFRFTVQAPNATGTYSEYFNLLAEGNTWMNDIGLYFVIDVVPAQLDFNYVSDTIASSMITDSTHTATVVLKNTGNVSWYQSSKYPIRLGTANPIERSSPFHHPSWLGTARPTQLASEVIAPGQNATFTFQLTAPHTPGNYSEAFTLVADGWAWFSRSFSKDIQVEGTYDSLVSGSPPNVNLVAGDLTTVTLSFTNNGTNAWHRGGTVPIRIGASEPIDRASRFCDSSWIACHRPVDLNEAEVKPGAVGSFTFKLRAPAPLPSGTYNEYFRMVAEGLKWFGVNQKVTVNVSAPNYNWQLTDQFAFADSTKAQRVDMAQLSPGQVIFIGFQARNTGNVAWYNNSINPLRVGASRPQDRQSLFCHTTWIACHRPVAMSEATVQPGEIATFEWHARMPSTPGLYDEYFTPMVEGYAWMQDIGLFYRARIR